MSAVPVLAARPRTAPTLSVDLAAIAANARTFGALTGGRLLAVVKADAFGHGAVAVARTVLEHGASRLGVATIGEALVLRSAGIAAPVLSWVNPVAADFEAAVRARVELAVPSVAHLNAMVAAAASSQTPARVHVQVDVGMSREGAPRAEWDALARAARTAELRGLVEVIGVMGHLPCAEDPQHPSNDAGRAAFLEAVVVARRAGLRPRIRHLAATAAALSRPDTRFDASRVGAGLYGIDPIGAGGLRGALTLTAPVVDVRDVPAGTPVGYGHRHVTTAPTRLALVGLGYADGIPRSADVAEVLVHGRRRPVVGVVSMDQTVIDVGDAAVALGDEVTILGPGDGGEPTVAEWAAWAHTIPHELMTGFGSRVTRVHT
ncbi:alanine racemase [Leifsonia sp. H3M29-4]|uniref:alanine racemase n=1 Tax=Salinibacterium metalliresistens TaxID=3031321 RepID=UPI0023DB883E|nr:alanine racemase [Salinibacterium metalliresistens]MDF1477790.1 alanine racemase [Salinibacterium metalliresistens]